MNSSVEIMKSATLSLLIFIFYFKDVLFFWCVFFVFGYYFSDILTSSSTFYATGILFFWDNTFTGNRFQRPGRRHGGDRKRIGHIIIIRRTYVPIYTYYTYRIDVQNASSSGSVLRRK